MEQPRCASILFDLRKQPAPRPAMQARLRSGAGGCSSCCGGGGPKPISHFSNPGWAPDIGPFGGKEGPGTFFKCAFCGKLKTLRTGGKACGRCGERFCEPCFRSHSCYDVRGKARPECAWMKAAGIAAAAVGRRPFDYRRIAGCGAPPVVGAGNAVVFVN